MRCPKKNRLHVFVDEVKSRPVRVASGSENGGVILQYRTVDRASNCFGVRIILGCARTYYYVCCVQTNDVPEREDIFFYN